ncbi:hypothetical protein BST33_10015 [Mycolicibacter minnesotensis]|uniref:Uncharacterized protein n=1 Tax=Mycolicibacter minnesotensis TaxID=1118379 RepID=A0A7I7R405_9MYCO|nr:hypothetical protein [Mycolicibacter minnesotensis]ORB01094.1 hypothetical protein BST33_10015 [Mycolicibacter minnesotensis]BBY33364.1 hypothetical protein MMIN_14250 [Mycolicibacter minnesotensis]
MATNPEVAEQFDAARDAIALLDASLRSDPAAGQLLMRQWTDRGEVLLGQLLAITTNLCRNVASLTGNQPSQVVETLRRATADAESALGG